MVCLIQLRFSFRPLMLRATLCSILIALFLPALSNATLAIRDSRWGFDGHAVPDTFNIFSVEFINTGRDAFDGVVRFLPDPFGSKQSTPYEEQCYIAPGGTRWVQFCVLVEPHGNKWILSWGDQPSESITVRHPDMDAPACVFLANDFSGLASAGFRRFPESLLPASSAAMDGLDAVLIDHAPRWEPARRRAFLEWLNAGGTVHVLQDGRGVHPVFPDDLAVLNAQKARLRVGAGTVLHHMATRQTVNSDYLVQANAAPATMAVNQHRYMRISDTLARSYTPVLRTNHRWWLIYLVAIVYIIAIGPGMMLCARRMRNYRHALLAFAGCVLLATGCMHWAGYRSERESNAVYTMACASPVGGGLFATRQWVTAFAGRGGGYMFHHAAPHNFYAPASGQEETAGLIRNGRDGTLLAKMPINSFRTFAYRGVLKGDDLSASVVDWSADSGLRSLRLKVSPDFPGETVALWALYRGTIVELSREEGQHLRARSEPASFAKLLEQRIQSSISSYYNPYAGNPHQDRDTLARQVAANMQYLLMAVALEGTDQTTYRITRPRLADNHITLMVMAKSPPGFFVNQEQFPQQCGYVLYYNDIEIPEER